MFYFKRQTQWSNVRMTKFEAWWLLLNQKVEIEDGKGISDIKIVGSTENRKPKGRKRRCKHFPWAGFDSTVPTCSFLTFHLMLRLNRTNIIKAVSNLVSKLYYVWARSSMDGWGVMLQAGRFRVRVSMRSLNFFNFSNPSNRTVALEFTQPQRWIPEDISGSQAWPTLKTNNVNSICEPIALLAFLYITYTELFLSIIWHIWDHFPYFEKWKHHFEIAMQSPCVFVCVCQSVYASP
jgi:hypothetical protein